MGPETQRQWFWSYCSSLTWEPPELHGSRPGLSSLGGNKGCRAARARGRAACLRPRHLTLITRPFSLESSPELRQRSSCRDPVTAGSSPWVCTHAHVKHVRTHVRHAHARVKHAHTGTCQLGNCVHLPSDASPFPMPRPALLLKRSLYLTQHLLNISSQHLTQHLLSTSHSTSPLNISSQHLTQHLLSPSHSASPLNISSQHLTQHFTLYPECVSESVSVLSVFLSVSLNVFSS